MLIPKYGSEIQKDPSIIFQPAPQIPSTLQVLGFSGAGRPRNRLRRQPVADGTRQLAVWADELAGGRDEDLLAIGLQREGRPNAERRQQHEVGGGRLICAHRAARQAARPLAVLPPAVAFPEAQALIVSRCG